MTNRLEELFRLIEPCTVFADIGCDHGYITDAVIKNGLAKRVYASDVSYPSLCKAKSLIGEENLDMVSFYHTDGFNNLPLDIDTAFIAGMGGEEICLILKQAKVLPKTLILQPMKNADKVRRLVVELGYFVQNDYTFFAEDKFYEVIKCTLNGRKSSYEENDYLFGRDNLLTKSPAFTAFITRRIEMLTGILGNLSAEKKADVQKEIEKLQGLIC